MKHKGKKGTIIVEFYRTTEVVKKLQINKFSKFEETKEEEVGTISKKSLNEAVSIKEGKTFNLSRP